jgi:hypothetical protein
MTNATIRRIGVAGVAVAGALFLPAGIAVAAEPASAACERSQPYYLNDGNLSHVVVNTGQDTQSRAQNCYPEAVAAVDVPNDGWGSVTGWLLTLIASDTDDDESDDDESGDESDDESDDDESDDESDGDESDDDESDDESDDDESKDESDDELGSADDSTPDREPAEKAQPNPAPAKAVPAKEEPAKEEPAKEEPAKEEPAKAERTTGTVPAPPPTRPAPRPGDELAREAAKRAVAEAVQTGERTTVPAPAWPAAGGRGLPTHRGAPRRPVQDASLAPARPENPDRGRERA